MFSTLHCIVLLSLHIFAAKKQTANTTKAMTNVDNTKSQMRKGMLEYCILLLLRHSPSYANDIIGKLKQAKMIVVEGTLYPLLNRLKKDGLLKYEWQESTQGPPRKYYALTEDGKEALIQLDESWNEMATTVHILQHNELLLPPTDTAETNNP